MNALFSKVGGRAAWLIRIAAVGCLVCTQSGCYLFKASDPVPVRPRGSLALHEVAPQSGPTTKVAPGSDGTSQFFLVDPPIINTADVESVADVSIAVDVAGGAGAQAGLEIVLTPAGAAKIAAATAKADGRTLAVVINGVVVSSPKVVSPIGQRFRISGNDDFQSVVDLITKPGGN